MYTYYMEDLGVTRDEWHLSILLTQLLSAVRDVVERLGGMEKSPLPSHIIDVVCEAELVALQVSLLDEAAGTENLYETITSLAAASKLVIENGAEFVPGQSQVCEPIRKLHRRVATVELALAQLNANPKCTPSLSADNATGA